MSFRKNLLHARHHFVFLLGLTVAFGFVFTIEQQEFRDDLVTHLIYSPDIPSNEPRPLNQAERQWALTAWQYFENNTQPSGLVNSVNDYPSTTLWDTSSYLMALIAASKLDIINETEFNQRMSAALASLAQLPLFDEQLPNKAYDTRSLAMVNYDNTPNERGIGWSAIDIGRLLVPFNILVWEYPTYTHQVNRVLSRWDLDPMLQESLLYGATVEQEQTLYVQEGRIGYEEYAGKSLNLMGKDVAQALRYTDFLILKEIEGVEVPTDSRDPKRFKAHNYVVSESYILDGLEFGWDKISHEFAWRVYSAQKSRYDRTGTLTAVSEDNIDRAPYFVYNTVFADGKAWNAISDSGEDASEFRTLSTKAAFGWYALYRDPYSLKLMDKASTLFNPEKGWYSGFYETLNETNKALTANTNGIILESLLYIEQGPLLRAGTQSDPVRLAQKESL
ncbi:DUF3131 domain-containing protein [Ferrimonas pelagia]|uniref:DUF3131 domain-containing protein n=1 Tax=Ferrimonas pelagia TaxID=1177826 RepID=A0ABP9FJM1_9GAMM